MLAAGLSKDDPAVKRALKFVRRCQNLGGEFNDQPFAKKTTKEDEGGFVYHPFETEKSPHKTPEGGLRSLGAMTYSGLKTFLYAGVSKDDPRVKAAIGWIRRHCTLDENPGMGQQGLFYYYQTFAKALDAAGYDAFEEADGARHDWRKELAEHLASIQQENGSWVNTSDRWYEGDPNLVTAYALLALERARELGVAAYVTKPFNLPALVQLVANVAQRRGVDRGAVHPAG